jgi:type VI secretion system secreted protein VgrG
VLVLSLCTFITIIEVRRASEGVWRAWAYMFEWPLIGLFTIWIWHRYRTEGSVTKGLVARWRDRVSRMSAEYEAGPGAHDEADVNAQVSANANANTNAGANANANANANTNAGANTNTNANTDADGRSYAVTGQGSQPASASSSTGESDPQLEAWTEYVAELRRREPPGAPPN